MAYVRKALLGDAFILAPKLRPIDVQECLAVFSTPLEALSSAIQNSKASWTIVEDDGTVIGSFGVSESSVKFVGYAWLLASEELHKHSKRFLKQSRAFVAEMKQHYPVLINYVDVRNTKSLLWLKWLGFTIDTKPIEYGLLKLPHFKFVG